MNMLVIVSGTNMAGAAAPIVHLPSHDDPAIAITTSVPFTASRKKKIVLASSCRATCVRQS
jgi:hypothetical protein